MTELSEYVDLSDRDKDAYECQHCGVITPEKFDRGDCPNCSREGVLRMSEWAKSFTPVDHAHEFTGYHNRVSRL